MQNTKVTIMSSSDGNWYGMYINGKLVYQNYSITAAEALVLLKRAGLPIEVSDVEMTQVNERNGNCPKRLRSSRAKIEE